MGAHIFQVKLPLSVLDLSPVSSGSSAAQALADTLELARLADRLGYRRYWMAEHHNIPSIASSSPEIMIGQVGRVTRQIRVGSGGIMLPNHAPLRVAEAFRTLEALFPGRVDLGIGRAPGTDPMTALALRRDPDSLTADDFPDRLAELMAFGDGGFPEGHPFQRVRALPDDVPLPPIWLLGSSDFSGRLAARLGLGFAFANHFSPEPTVPVMREYAATFRPSARLGAPASILTVAAICADTQAEADRLATTLELSWVRLRTGRAAPLASPEEALAYPYSAVEREIADFARRLAFVGTAAAVRERIEALAAETRATEVMVTTMTHDPRARRHSYVLLAKAFELGS